MMITKTISSTAAKNNLGQVVDDAMQNDVCYIIKRRDVARVIVVSVPHLARILEDESERKVVAELLGALRPEYHLGEVIENRSGKK